MATRLAISFWVGGAILFVITSVAEQRYPPFDSLIRDQLATIRFPLYYIFGWSCLGTTLMASLIAAVLNRGCLRKRLLACFCLTLLSTGIAVVDYKWVYQPLQVLITPPGQARTQQFIALHNQSRQINEVHLTIALVAAIIICLPERSPGECKA
jgi:hypothetical protein